MSDSKDSKLFRVLVVTLLLINTFFIGSIWCKVVVQCGVSKKMCFLGQNDSGKMCPFSQKSSDYQKGPQAN